MVPRHEGVEITVRPTGCDALEGEFQPGMWIDAVEFGCGQYGGYVGPCSASPIGTREKCILTCDRMESDGPLDDVGVDFDPTVGKEAFQDRSTAKCITDRFGQPGFTRQARQLAIEGCEELAHDCAGSLLTYPAAMVGIVAADFVLDLPERRRGFDDLCSEA